MIDLAKQPMLITWGPDRLIFYNEAFTPILDDKPGSQGCAIATVFEESWDVVADMFLHAEQGKGTYLENLRVPIRRNGRVQDSWWTTSYSRLPTEEGEGPGVLCVLHETTQLHLAELGRKHAQDDLARIADLVPSLLWRADGFGRTTWRNGRLEALAAARGADAGNLWRKLMHPQDIGDLMSELSAAKTERRAFSKLVRLRISDDEYRWHQIRSEPVLDPAGDLIGWCGVGTDIQDIRDAVENLEDGKALFEQFAANSAALLWVGDLATRQITWLSPNFGSIWPEALSDQSWSWGEFMSSVLEADRPALQAGWAKASAGEVASGRFRVTGASGLRVLEGTTFPLRSDGKVLCVGGILQDVTRDIPMVVHLIDTDAGARNALTHALRKFGLEVAAHDSVDVFARMVSALAAGPVLYRQPATGEGVDRLAGLLAASSLRRPWLIIRNADRPLRDVVDMMKAGASDVLEPDATPSDVAQALRIAASKLAHASSRS